MDWERGAEVFEKWLIDHETACNVGNWQWLSCTAFYSQFYRCYSPVAFPQKWDKDGEFVRHFVPELARYDRKFIYEPWKAPIVDQKKWGCVVRGDGGVEEGKLDERLEEEDGYRVYPKPMFDFPQRREICIQGIKKAYQVGLRGNDSKVLDGTWRALFEDSDEGPTEGRAGPPGAMIADDYVNMDDPLEGKEVMEGVGLDRNEGVEEVNAGREVDEESRRKGTQHKRKPDKGQQMTLDAVVVKRVKR